ncbi:LytTR family DNA-binding domain-containing protein [Chitinophaga sp. Cy-1792]|uniref:LytR/AlgR family response regulator transcription factor n=1 Tax=Chitinophaga sp. Cy-1792 TaxID=2608339 RepID=UPI00141D890F|nr:LytTR family DNA-binding domain-containing protein [Chitinophaga sp. Cy-1792]NIG55072.1 response regulator transcription factor [Chitinophaga sp. Cy-1792]
MNIVIIEDERPNAERLKRLIAELRPNAVIKAVLESVAETLQWLQQHPQPDLILMDIKLGDGVSFEIFEKTNISAPVIFTTAYDEYAIQAFKQNSIDYLLKPVEKEELSAALEKFDRILPAASTLSLEKLLQDIKPKNYRSRFLIPYRDGFKTILADSTLYFCSEQKVTKARLLNGDEETVPLTLDELELQLDPKTFFRANRQYIINIEAVDIIHNYFNNKLKVQLKRFQDVEIIVSRDKAPLLKAWLGY